MQSTIREVRAREILDSRGNPTVEVDLQTSLGTFRASVPSGASTGEYEAVELRDQDRNRFGGKGVLKAVKNVNEIIRPALVGEQCSCQILIDNKLIALDGTQQKETLGANAILAASLAACKAGAAAHQLEYFEYISQLAGTKEMSLPIPWMNVINGGQHAGNRLQMQEFMVAPVGAENFQEAMRMGSEVYHTLRKIIIDKHGPAAASIGDEGGFAPDVEDHIEALDLIMDAIEKSGHKGKFTIGMDVAASELCDKEGKYKLYHDRPSLDRSGLLQVYKDCVRDYPISSIEDPFDENDWDGFIQMSKELGEVIQIVGDDLTATNPSRIQRAIATNACNALLLKLNQIGSVSEAIESFKLARDAGWNVMVSHRSGETEETSIADFAVGLGSGQIKAGAPCRTDRTSKYNQLMRIEQASKLKYWNNEGRKGGAGGGREWRC